MSNLPISRSFSAQIVLSSNTTTLNNCFTLISSQWTLCFPVQKLSSFATFSATYPNRVAFYITTFVISYTATVVPFICFANLSLQQADKHLSCLHRPIWVFYFSLFCASLNNVGCFLVSFRSRSHYISDNFFKAGIVIKLNTSHTTLRSFRRRHNACLNNRSITSWWGNRLFYISHC